MNLNQPQCFYSITQGMVLLAMASLAVSGHAAVQLIAPEEVAVMAVDQQEVSSGLLRSRQTTYKLDPGRHDIAVRYEQIFHHSNGEHDVLKSAMVSLRADLADQQTYRLALVNPPKHFDEASRYVKQPTFAIYDEQGKLVSQQQALDNSPKPLLGGGLFGRMVDFSGSKKNQIQQATALYSPTSTANPVTTNPVTPSPASTNPATTNPASTNPATSSPVTSGTLEQLKLLWKNTTEQERQQFIQHIIR